MCIHTHCYLETMCVYTYILLLGDHVCIYIHTHCYLETMCVYTYTLLLGDHVCIYIHIATWRPCVYIHTYTLLLGDHVCIYIHIATWRPCLCICIYVALWSHVLCLLYCLFMDCCLPHIPICILWLREEYSCISFTISSPDCTMHTAIYHMVAALEGRFPRAICPKKAGETLHC